MDLTIVDVFAEQALAGNQLAVVRDCDGLHDGTMQDIAREMNFSETTFVMREGAGEADVRIFTPSAELPFAGHPTVGTAWVLAEGQGKITLNLRAGPVPVHFERGIGWMTPPPVALGDPFDADIAARLVGLPADRIDPVFPVRLAEVGPKFVLVGLKDLAALKAAKLDAVLHERCLADGLSVNCVFVFTAEAYGPDADFASRMFFDSAGPREDPATGSANTAFAAYLRDLGRTGVRVVVDQGVEIKRPSRLYLDLGDPLRVGGRTRLVATGRFAPEIAGG